MVRSRDVESDEGAPTGTLASPAPGARRAGLAVVRSPVLWILFLAGLFDGLSDSWVHAAVLWGAGIAVGWDVTRGALGLATPAAVPLLAGSGSWRPWVWGTVVASGVAYAVLVGSLSRYTWPVTAAIVVPGALLLALGWRGPLLPRSVPPAPRRLGAALWAAILVAAGLWELTALLLQPSLQDSSYDHPTVSYLMDDLLSSHAGRTVTLLGWLVLGAYLLSRATTSEEPSGAARAQGPSDGDR